MRKKVKAWWHSPQSSGGRWRADGVRRWADEGRQWASGVGSGPICERAGCHHFFSRSMVDRGVLRCPRDRCGPIGWFLFDFSRSTWTKGGFSGVSRGSLCFWWIGDLCCAIEPLGQEPILIWQLERQFDANRNRFLIWFGF